jgi:hypothetical protein
MFPELLSILGQLDWLVLFALLIIGIVIIVVLVKIIFFILPAAIIAVIVWIFTGGNMLLTGIAFIAVALLSILKR